MSAVFPLSYLILILAVGAERLSELVTARRNERWSRARGAIESGRGHYPFMVVLHTGLLLGGLLEAWLVPRPFHAALGWPMLALVLAAQLLRVWCIRTLGRRWNTRVLVIPGLPPIAAGPYRFLPHPNYVAVVVEGAALPLVHTAWITALVFTALNLPLLATRIRAEDTALAAGAP